MTSAPKRGQVVTEEAVDMSSMPQHAVANGIGHRLFARA